MNQPLRKNLVGILYCGVQLTMKTTKSTYMHEYPDKFSKKPSLSKQIQLFNPKTPFVNPATETQLQSSSPKANPLNQSCLNVHVHILPIISPLKLAIVNLFLYLTRSSKMIALSPLIIRPNTANDSELTFEYGDHWFNQIHPSTYRKQIISLAL